MAGGGFGRRASRPATIVVEACDVAKAARAAGLNAPVRTLWSREDDIKGGYYRPHAPAPRRDRLRRAGQGRWPGTTSSSASRSLTGSRVRARSWSRTASTRTAIEGMREPYAAADAPDRAPPQAQRAGAVVAQRGLHPHRLRDGDADRRDRPHHQAGPGGLPHEADRRQAPAPPGGAAAGGRQVRLRQDASLPAGRAWGVAVHESFDSVVAYVVEASVQGRHADAAQRDGRRALQPGGQPAERGSAGAGRRA